MAEVAIQAERLSKQYRIGAREQYRALRDTLGDALSAPARGVRAVLRRGPATDTDETADRIWSLRDVSFQVEPGEVVGVVGRNGAGKSTLLKVLSRITEPTAGRVVIRGRVGSLLEVGTGFHPELTGRENIFLNGAILGMSRTEIRRKFDEIVAFAEIERFVDTPVKRYSSGMYMRLAFAVAAHLDSEILLVDEVLAVGDSAFQRKCLGKMSDVARTGRTVLFVSHNMAAVQSLCRRAMLLDGGRLVSEGPANDIVQQYLKVAAVGDRGATSDLASVPRERGLRPLLVSGELNGAPLLGEHAVVPLDDLEMSLELSLLEPLRACTLGIHFEDDLGVRAYAVHTRWQLRPVNLDAGRHRVVCRIPQLPLVPGRYYVAIGVSSEGQQADWIDRAATLEIVKGDVYGTGELPQWGQGYFLSRADWDIQPVLAPELAVAGPSRLA